MFEWERIDEKSQGYTERARIFGGWLIRTYISGGQDDPVAICYVPDRNHEWEIN